MGHFPKGIRPIIGVHINLVLKKRSEIKPEIKDLFRIHRLLLFPDGQGGRNFTLRVRRVML